MSTRQARLETKLIDWAMACEQAPHDPCSASESIEYKIMTTGQVTRGNRISDGGLGRAVERYREDIEAEEKRLVITHIVARLKARDPEAYEVVTIAFLDRPGRIISGRAGAREIGVSENNWRMRYQRGLAFVDGALSSA